MAQTEDTELRDLVIDALERNGSLAKIRALLRANIFLAFEDECENLKQNVNLDNIIKLPEGKLALSIIHEFLEFCCLKNTLFVYMSESRQGNEYSYDGKKVLAEKLNLPKCDISKEPLLLTLMKNAKSDNKKYFEPKEKNNDKYGDKNYNEEQNCTYILHEDSQSSTTSHSQSDNSSDEKNKLHLQLQLDNSDTDTSSDSTRDKTSSEYIPGDHILDITKDNNTKYVLQKSSDCDSLKSQNNVLPHDKLVHEPSLLMHELKISTISSSDSTSYIDLKPFNSLDEKMLNTAGLPVVSEISDQIKPYSITNINHSASDKNELLNSIHLSNVKEKENKVDTSDIKSGTSDVETAEFSYRDDFSSSPLKKKDNSDKQDKSVIESVQNELEKSSNGNSSGDSPHQVSQSSQSSISISDVADLISEKSSLSHTNNLKNNPKGITHSKQSKVHSDDSGDFTDSPVPSLSNLSLDIHSD